ncbi:MAG TPA: 6-phosphogluconolactonase [Clostridiaceae bacterium]|nr:6-phosphogluconolactonase [Clostridiaceae bacterium]
MQGKNSNCTAFIGTFTSGDNKGIYIYNVDLQTGMLKQIGISPKIDNPSYLTITKDNNFLYSVIETNEFENAYGGAVASFSIDKNTDRLKLLNIQPTKGKGPCYILTDSKRRFLFTANYAEGTLSEFPIESDGRIGPLLFTVNDYDYDFGTKPAGSPHAHFVAFTPDERYLCSVDLGLDRIYFFEFNHENGELIFSRNISLSLAAGKGPRHLAFHPEANFVYIISELSSEIFVFKYDPSDYKLHNIQTVSALPEGYTGKSTCAAIHISKDGKFLYASNRGHDSIAAFKINETSGRIELISHYSTRGKCPRDFGISPDGNYLYALNQSSDTIVSFDIDKQTGALIPTNDIVNVPAPVCIKFLSR